MNIHALVLAIVHASGALVHVGAIKSIVFRCFQAFRADARETALEIHARVRAQVQSALVDIDAAHSVLVKLIPTGTDANRPFFRLLALVGARSRQTLASVRSIAGEIVLLQGESKRTGAIEGTNGVVTGVGTRGEWSIAFVDVVAGHTVFVELETQATSAVVTTGLVHALVLATVRLPFVTLRALVDVWDDNCKIHFGITFGTYLFVFANCGFLQNAHNYSMHKIIK